MLARPLNSSLIGCNRSSNEGTEMDKQNNEQTQYRDLYISTETQSASRASVLPTEGSEDVSSLLGEIAPPKPTRTNTEEYLPNPAVEWIVHATFAKPLKSMDVASKFGKDWRAIYGGLTIYGRDTATGLWTFLISADGPEEISSLQFAWDYYSSWSEDAKLVPPAMYESRLEAVRQKLNQLTPSKVHSDVKPKDAFEKSKTLSTIGDRLNRSITVRLIAPVGKRFSGRELWDVMLCLGLRWGDMDCFHWNNPTDYGDDYFFSVWTSTQPGYFLPEEVAADRVSVEDLVFGYSIPRCAAPVTVYERMMKAIGYAKKRLGGTITAVDGRPLNEDATLSEIKAISTELEILGFRPGSDNALQQF